MTRSPVQPVRRPTTRRVARPLAVVLALAMAFSGLSLVTAVAACSPAAPTVPAGEEHETAPEAASTRCPRRTATPPPPDGAADASTWAAAYSRFAPGRLHATPPPVHTGHGPLGPHPRC